MSTEHCIEAIKVQFLDPLQPPTGGEKISIAATALLRLAEAEAPESKEFQETLILAQGASLQLVIYFQTREDGDWDLYAADIVGRYLDSVKRLMKLQEPK